MGHEKIDAVREWRGDWPACNTEIVLADHEVPHPECGTEQWYFHCQLTTSTGEKHDLFCAFARYEATSQDNERLVTHSLRWARIDQADGFCISQSWLDRVDLLRRAAEADCVMDPHVQAALVEALSSGQPVGPDRLLPRPVRVEADGLGLDYGGVGSLRARADGSYEVAVVDECERFCLTFTPEKTALVAGDDGIIRGRYSDGSDAQFAYVVPRLTVEGTVVPVGGSAMRVSGTGWHEHAFGGDWYRLEKHRAADRGWDWVRIQLNNGWDLSAAVVRHTDAGDGTGPGDQVVSIACAPDGRRVPCTMTLNTAQPWMSVRTLQTYPTQLDVVAADLGLSLTVRTRVPQQEIQSVALGVRSLGPCSVVEGMMMGEQVQGLAFIDLGPFNRIDDFENYPRRLDPIVQAEIASLYPDTFTAECAARLTSVDDSVLDAVSLKQLHRALIAPIRHVTDSGGKNWRAYVTHTMAGMCGVRSQEWLGMLGRMELLHSAMLAIDDIEDGSVQRRGRPAAHVVFGTAETMNAAYALTFIIAQPTDERMQEDTPAELRLRVYQDYMKALRLTHVGQALDIAGHADAMDTAIATGDPGPLLMAIRAVYRLKTSQAFCFAADGLTTWAAIDNAHAAVMREYWDAVGLVFQITDDLLDLHGLTGLDATGQRRRMRRACEDLHAGRVTMPMAHAVRLLPRAEMGLLWKSVRGGDADEATVHRAAQTLADCGAVEACYAEAKALIDEKWKLLDEVPASYPKVMCRAVGLWVACRRGGGDAA